MEKILNLLKLIEANAKKAQKQTNMSHVLGEVATISIQAEQVAKIISDEIKKDIKGN